MYNSQYYTCEQIDERLLQGYVDDYNTQTGQSLTKEQFLTKLGNIFDKETVIDNTAVNIGYFICDTAAGTAAKAITAAGYALFQGGSIKVKFLNRNTAGSATLNINSQGAKALYYGGKAVSASNSWDNGEVVEIYYDGTSYYANNVEGNFKDGIFDISAYNLTEGQPTKYADLAEALGTNGNNVPPIFRKGGMQIKYVSTSDNKYIQFRFTLSSFTNAQFANVAYWQRELTEYNLIKLAWMGTGGATGHITEVGQFYYNTSTKLLKRCIRIRETLDGNDFVNVPFCDGSIYTYSNKLYIWNGEDMVSVGHVISVSPQTTHGDLIATIDIDGSTYSIKSGISGRSICECICRAISFTGNNTVTLGADTGAYMYFYRAGYNRVSKSLPSPAVTYTLNSDNQFLIYDYNTDNISLSNEYTENQVLLLKWDGVKGINGGVLYKYYQDQIIQDNKDKIDIAYPKITKFENSIKKLNKYQFVVGSLSAETGGQITREDRARTDFILYNDDSKNVIIHCNAAYTIQLFIYGSDKIYKGYSNSYSTTVDGDKVLSISHRLLSNGDYYRIVVNTGSKSNYISSGLLLTFNSLYIISDVDKQTRNIRYLDNWYVGGINTIGGRQVNQNWTYSSLISWYYWANAGDILKLNNMTEYSAEVARYSFVYGDEYKYLGKNSVADDYVFSGKCLFRVILTPNTATTYDGKKYKADIPDAVLNCVSLTECLDTNSLNNGSIPKIPLMKLGQSIVKSMNTPQGSAFGNTDTCVVGQQLWQFVENTVDNGNEINSIHKMDFDFDNGTITLADVEPLPTHNLGHINSINYNEEYDALICGNGSSSYSLEPKFFIIENASTRQTIYQNSQNGEYIGNVIEITDDILEGTKLNVIWGESNDELHDIAYLIFDDGRKISKIQLGRGSNELSYGTLIPNTTGFNGTFNILLTHCQPDYGYAMCIQGSDYVNGSIYCGVGHQTGGATVRKFTLCQEELKVEDIFCKFYNADGSESTNYWNNCIGYKNYVMGGFSKMRVLDTLFFD